MRFLGKVALAFFAKSKNPECVQYLHDTSKREQPGLVRPGPLMRNNKCCTRFDPE